jgi:hypothetical protein
MMVAMNSDPASLPELFGQEDNPNLRLVPTPAEQATLGMPPEEVDRRGFSQGIYAHAVRECCDAESLPPEERDPEMVRTLADRKDNLLLKLPEEKRPDAIFSAYSWLIDRRAPQEQAVA